MIHIIFNEWYRSSSSIYFSVSFPRKDILEVQKVSRWEIKRITERSTPFMVYMRSLVPCFSPLWLLRLPYICGKYVLYHSNRWTYLSHVLIVSKIATISNLAWELITKFTTNIETREPRLYLFLHIMQGSFNCFMIYYHLCNSCDGHWSLQNQIVPLLCTLFTAVLGLN